MRRVRDEGDTRKAALRGHEALVGSISALLLRHDPMGIDYGQGPDEYDPEAETIALRLLDWEGPLDVDSAREIVNDEIVRWFGEEYGGPDLYRDIAVELQTLWADASRGTVEQALRAERREVE